MGNKPEFGPNGAVINNPEMSEELRRDYLNAPLLGRGNYLAPAKGGIFALLFDLPFVIYFGVEYYRVQATEGDNVSSILLTVLIGWVFFKVLHEKFGRKVTSKWAVANIIYAGVLSGLWFFARGASYLVAQQIMHWSLMVGSVLLMGAVVGHLLWLGKRERA